MDKYTLAGKLGYYFTNMISKTIKTKIFQDEEYDEEKTYVYAFWHNKMYIPMVSMRESSYKITNLVSPSKDGTILSTILKKYGYLTVRGSSNKESVKSLIKIIRMLKTGISAVFAVDGPKGPIYEPKQGVIYAAKKSGVEIVPLGAYIDRKWTFEKSWDKLLIPKAFSKSAYVIGKPFKVDKEADISEYVEILKNKLFEVDKQAEKMIIGDKDE